MNTLFPVVIQNKNCHKTRINLIITEATFLAIVASLSDNFRKVITQLYGKRNYVVKIIIGLKLTTNILT
jgi:alpha-glucuronidase